MVIDLGVRWHASSLALPCKQPNQLEWQSTRLVSVWPRARSHREGSLLQGCLKLADACWREAKVVAWPAMLKPIIAI